MILTAEKPRAELDETVESVEKEIYASAAGIRPLYWALVYHRNIRGERMEFPKDAGTNYLWDLYATIDDIPYMVVEKSVQCFPGGTKVVTPFGYVPIEDIDVGDLVLTHTGNYLPVTKTFERVVGEELIERRADLSPRIRSTAEHPFYAYRYDHEKYHHNKEKKVFGSGAKWVAASCLRDGDFVARAKIPLSTGEEKVASIIEHCDRPIKNQDADWFMEKWGQRYTARRAVLDYGFGQLVGLYVAEGWINEDRDGRSKRLCFGFHRDEVKLEQIVRREIGRLYRGKDPVHTYVGDTDNCRRVFVSSYPLVAAFRWWFGEGAANKSIPLFWLRRAPSSFLQGVLDGALLGDGSRGKGSQSNYRTVSVNLANEIRFIAAMCGIYGVIREEHPKGKQTVYSFVYSDPRNREYTRVQDINANHVAVRVKKTKKVPFEGTVYNLEVARDNSYVVEDYVVHNCGLSELFIIQSHLEAAERGMSVMYVLPKYELRNRFVNNRIYKLHKRASHYAANVLMAETKVHRTSLMHFGNGTLAYVGSNVQDEFIEIPIDSAFVDEKDRCNLSNLLMLPDRLTASPYQYEREISNPTVEGFGIDERYAESSMGEWKLKCPGCGKWFTPDFFKHVVRETSTNVFAPRDKNADPDPLEEREIRLIHDCGTPVDRLGPGEWVHAYPSRKWQGFRVSKIISQLSPKGSLRNLYRTWQKAVGNDLKTQIFFNSDLGLPFSSKGARITRAMLNDCRRKYEYPPRRVSRSRPRFMGVDVGENLHVVLRERVRSADGVTMRLLGTWTVPGFSQLGQIMREWQPNCTVIDALPEIHKVMELKADFANVWSSRFQESVTTFTKSEQKKEISMNRTAIIDYVRQGFELQQLINPMNAEFLEEGEYYNHLMAPTRILEANEEHPEKSRFVWKEGSRPDHFCFAEAYCLQAGMVMPDHGVFEFFEQEANALSEHTDRRNVTGTTLSDEERQRVADLARLRPEAALIQIRDRNKKEAPKRAVDDEKIHDTIDFMFKSQGYVDVVLAAQMADESEGSVRRVLLTEGYKQTRIAGQYKKGG